MLNRIPVVAGSHIAQYIYGLATHPDYRGRGYAGKLLTEALESPEYSLAALMPERPSLIGFYERFGFTRRGSLPKDGRAVLIYSAEEIPEEVYIELAEKIKFFETEES
jgi:ribosomal protein S18 acetylase RimI-like enzyme